MKDRHELGLRERKRQQTRHRIELAAAEIVESKGLDALTIEAISLRAGISPRTIFNYFDSKEDALIGVRRENDTRRIIEQVLERVSAGPLLDRVIDLLLGVAYGPGLDPRLRARRRRIIHAHPELMQRRFLNLRTVLGPLTDATRTLMQGTGEAERVTEHEARAQAEILLMMCGTALRAAILELAGPTAELDAEQAGELLRTRAITLIRQTIGSTL